MCTCTLLILMFNGYGIFGAVVVPALSEGPTFPLLKTPATLLVVVELDDVEHR
jgi:hypothetical protein